MEKILQGRGTGKTTKLIKMSHDTWTYILVSDSKRAKYVFGLAKELGVSIPFPVSVSEYFQGGRFTGSHIKGILIDDADDVLQQVFRDLTIKALTMTY